MHRVKSFHGVNIINRHFWKIVAPHGVHGLKGGLYANLSGLVGLALLFPVMFPGLLGRRKAGSYRLIFPKKPLRTGRALARALRNSKGLTLLGLSANSGLSALWRGAKRFWLTREHRERHMQIMGPTRSGKSQLLLSIAAQDMAKGMPIFFMEAKGDVGDLRQFLRLAEQTGRLGDVRYFNPAEPESMTFNPIRPIPGQDPMAVANQISRAIGREPGGGGDAEYFKGLDYARIQTMAEIFMATGRAFTLRDAFYYFEFESCRNKAYSLCADKYLIPLARKQFEGRSSDTSALTSKLRPWISGRLGELLNSYSPQIRLEDLFDRNRLAYFAIPIGHLQVLANSLGRMVVAGLQAVAFKRQRTEPKPGAASVILDEFPEFATPSFASFIATVGSARLWTIFSHQDLGQLKKVEGIDPEVFFSALFSNSSGCKVFFHLPHPADADLVARAVGTCTAVKVTEVAESSMWGDGRTGRKSLREVEEFIAHPNFLRTLPSGIAVACAHRRAPAVISTAAAHELIEEGKTPALPKVEGVPEKGLDLASAAPKEGGKDKDDRDFTGRPAGPVGK